MLKEYLKNNYLIILILALGFVLRAWGIWHDLPLVSTVGDELPAVSVSAGMLARHSFMPQATFGTDFPLLYYVYLISFLPYLFGLFIIKGFSFLAVKQTIALDMSGLLLAARISSLLMGTATVWLVYAISRRIFKSRLPAYFAALLFALDPLNVSLSHFARIWGPQIFFIYLSLYFSLRYFGDRERSLSWKEYAVTAAFILLAIGVSLPGLFAYFLWLITVAVYRFGFNWKFFLKFLFNRQSVFFHSLLLLGGLVIIFFSRDALPLYKEIYFMFFSSGSLNAKEFISFEGETFARSTLPMWQKIGLSFNAFWQYESAAFLLLIPALFLIFKKNKRLFSFLFLSFLALFLCLNPPLINSARPRYIATLMPFIILPAAWLAAEIFSRFRKKNFLLALLFILLIISPTLLLSFRNDYLLAKNSSSRDLYYWLKNNLRADERVFVYGAYLSQEFLPSQELLGQIKEFSPGYYSARLKYLADNFPDGRFGGYNVYSAGFFCDFPPEQIKQTKFKYVIISENSDLGINLADFKICGLAAVDLSRIKPVFSRDTAPFFRYSILESYVINQDLHAQSYRPLLKIKQLGPRINVYQINQ